MLLTLSLALGAPPLPVAPECTVEPDKDRWRALRDLARAELRDARRRPDRPGNKYRLQIVRDYVDNGWICAADDAVHASQVLMRSPQRGDHLLAYHFLAWAHAEQHEEAGALAALAYDQYLTGGGLPQWYGAQTALDAGKVCLYPVDPAASDADRAALGARSLKAVVRDVYLFAEKTPPSGADLPALESAGMICESKRTLAPRIYDAETLYDTVSSSGGHFNHDGTKLLVSSNATGVYNVYAQPVKGGEMEPLTRSESDARWAVDWFPGDDRFLYSSDTAGDELYHLFVQDPDGGSVDLTPGEGHRASFGGWTADRTGFFVTTNERDPKAMDVYRYEDANGYPRELVFENTEALSLGDISDDGHWLVLEETHSNVDTDLFLIDLTSAEAERIHLTPHEGPVTYGTYGFEPGGAGLWYGSNAEGEFTSAYRYDLVAEKHEVRIEADWDVVDVDFSDGGTWMAYRLNADAQTEIHLMDVESGEEVDPASGLPNGAITNVRFSPDEEALGVWVSTDTAPSALYVAPVGGGAQQVVAPDSSVDPTDLVTAEVVRFESFDGLEIPALLYVPHTATSEDPVPAVVWVHGGPGGQTRRGYRADIQYLVNHGYAVLGINNRGSSGYGKTFHHADDRKHGDVDLKDCIAGRDFLAGLDGVDGERIGIMGGSYGGYMVLAALAFTPDAFDVGVDIFGVSNWIRTLESIPPWWESYRAYLHAELGDPVADRESLEARSPLLHAEKITKPLFVVQGKNDPRVLEAESSEIVAAVEANGVPVQYVLFDDEGHGFVKTENRIEAATKWLGFLDAHLRTAAESP